MNASNGREIDVVRDFLGRNISRRADNDHKSTEKIHFLQGRYCRWGWFARDDI